MATDSENMIATLKDFPGMMEKALVLGDDISIEKKEIENITVVGMGGRVTWASSIVLQECIGTVCRAHPTKLKYRLLW